MMAPLSTGAVQSTTMFEPDTDVVGAAGVSGVLVRTAAPPSEDVPLAPSLFVASTVATTVAPYGREKGDACKVEIGIVH